ncbi:MAG TPA: hypothetical protein VIY48_09105 [Candidatus Paceibacterota bacterium]
MSDDTNTTPDGITIVPVSDDSPISARDAANALTQFRWKKDAKEEQPAEAPVEAAAPTEDSAPAEDAAPAEEATGAEPTETATEPAEELPPIEAPRSWTKEQKEQFKELPRTAQEVIAQREQDRETTLRRGQNELAEQRKALEAERGKVDQARQQYEAALPQLLATLQEQQQGEFADIKTMADVEKLAREDWPRYALWDAQQKKVAAVTQELRASQERQSHEFEARWQQFAAEEDAKFIEKAPEMADKAKASQIADASIALLKDMGFTESDLATLWSGKASLSLRDHRAQLLIRDAVRYRQAQKAAPAKVAAKPVPPVQKPGSSVGKQSADEVLTKNLEQKLERSGNVKDAVALMMARRSARR